MEDAPDETSIEALTSNAETQPPLATNDLFPRKKSPELRLTVVDSIYYQQPGIEAIQIEADYSYFVQDNEQAYQRVAFISEEWKPLDTGWLNKASCVVIQNRYQLQTQRNPTPEEFVDASRHVIEVRFKDSSDSFLLAPKESLRFRPADLSRLEIRSMYGSTRYACSIIPE